MEAEEMTLVLRGQLKTVKSTMMKEAMTKLFNYVTQLGERQAVGSRRLWAMLRRWWRGIRVGMAPRVTVLGKH
jgi:hypothetical protein